MSTKNKSIWESFLVDKLCLEIGIIKDEIAIGWGHDKVANWKEIEHKILNLKSKYTSNFVGIIDDQNDSLIEIDQTCKKTIVSKIEVLEYYFQSKKAFKKVI